MRRFLLVGVATAALCMPAAAGDQNKAPDRQSQSQQSHGQRAGNSQNHWALTSGQVNDTRQALKDVQQELNDRGFDAGRADGMWGRKTAQAVQRFQTANSIQASGRLDDATIGKLGLNFGQQNQNEPSTTGSGSSNEPSTTGSGGDDLQRREAPPDDTRAGPDVPKSPSGDDMSD